MRKLNFNFQNKGEVLSREQLKQVLGGSGSGSAVPCKCEDGREYTLDCSEVTGEQCGIACFNLCS
ncbi:natural product precursor [Olivibacter domesticus]|uniref:Natural product n=1 Tax=Olivibacter domesticus TaxID=407022 RepID=A0A1H7JT28_OLID1|nr:natural product precursor [Olivibacter domesticus]